MKIVKPFNADKQGLCRTIKAQYYKNGVANFLHTGGAFAATAVIEYEVEDRIPYRERAYRRGEDAQTPTR